jgi:hypothetical protein
VRSSSEARTNKLRPHQKGTSITSVIHNVAACTDDIAILSLAARATNVPPTRDRMRGPDLDDLGAVAGGGIELAFTLRGAFAPGSEIPC